MFLEFIGNVHNDVIVVFFVLLSLYFLLKKKKIIPDVTLKLFLRLNKQMKNEECNCAIKRIFDKINIEEINNFIAQIESMSDVRKEFYKYIINCRYEIIKEVYRNLVK